MSVPTQDVGMARIKRGDNSFGLLRLVFAVMVIITHAFPLGGFGPDPLWGISAGQLSFGVVGVGGFFVISGFLITSSGVNNDVLQFAWKRVLRIFPAYWVVLAVTASVVAPLVYYGAHGQLAGFWSQYPSPVDYVKCNFWLEVHQWGIGKLLISTPYGQDAGASVFNGSLWSLIYEFRCYLAVAVLIALGFLKRAKFAVPLVSLLFAIAMAGYNVAPRIRPLVLTVVGDLQMLYMGFLFSLGATLAVYATRVPVNRWLAVMSTIVFLLTARYGWLFPVGAIAFAYLILWAAAALPTVFRRIGRKHDISYGVYLYGFLALQLLAVISFFRFGLLAYIVAATVFSCICGGISWHVVEKRALSLKRIGPGRGLMYWWSRTLYIVRGARGRR